MLWFHRLFKRGPQIVDTIVGQFDSLTKALQEAVVLIQATQRKNDEAVVERRRAFEEFEAKQGGRN